jgi:hypothetical protein
MPSGLRLSRGLNFNSDEQLARSTAYPPSTSQLEVKVHKTTEMEIENSDGTSFKADDRAAWDAV